MGKAFRQAADNLLWRKGRERVKSCNLFGITRVELAIFEINVRILNLMVPKEFHLCHLKDEFITSPVDDLWRFSLRN